MWQIGFCLDVFQHVADLFHFSFDLVQHVDFRLILSVTSTWVSNAFCELRTISRALDQIVYADRRLRIK